MTDKFIGIGAPFLKRYPTDAYFLESGEEAIHIKTFAWPL